CQRAHCPAPVRRRDRAGASRDRTAARLCAGSFRRRGCCNLPPRLHGSQSAVGYGCADCRRKPGPLFAVGGWNCGSREARRCEEAVVTATADARQRLTRTARIKWLMLLGDRDDALEVLQGVGHELMFGQDNVWQPAFDPIRNNPRFKAVLKQMGLPYTPAGV